MEHQIRHLNNTKMKLYYLPAHIRLLEVLYIFNVVGEFAYDANKLYYINEPRRPSDLLDKT